ncbi:DUF6286 domain-containing protein [Kitasatospora sp. NPDC059722]|uniref:DUF6286 domain-containing protein n=1 Tax=unclassified Kitasatospora TaxID=2633591 RepID=UPI00364ECA99
MTAPEEGEAGAGAGEGKVRRPRAARTPEAVLVAAGVLVIAGALLYDVVSVRTGHSVRRWRAEIADELATRHLDDLWVLVGAGAATGLGALLLWLAFAPGLRRWLALRPHGGTSAVINRSGIGHLLTDRAAGLPDVERVRIQIGRRRVRVHLYGPSDPASLQRQLRDELARVTLARPLRLDVRTVPREGAGEAETEAAGSAGGVGGAAG